MKPLPLGKVSLFIFQLLVSALILTGVAFAWTNPTQAPPNGNVSLPSAQWTASGTAIYNSNSGNVGVGTSTPGQKFSVYGIVQSITGGFRFPDGTTQTSTATKNIRVRAYHNANQAISTGFTGAAIAFNSERWDTDNMHSTSTNNTRLTVQTAGTYLVIGQAQWQNVPTSTGIRRIQIRLNGTTVLSSTSWKVTDSSGDQNEDQVVSTIYPLNAGDYVELVASQTSGSDKDIYSSSEFGPEFMMQLLN